MKALWSGNIVIGFITIPVKLYSMQKDHQIEFRLIHKQCGTPINYKKWCPHCNREVKDEEIVKGYEISKGEYIIIEEDELEVLKPKSSKQIKIDRFVNFFEVDPHYFNKSYILVPNKSEEGYSVLLKALEEKGKAALGRIILRRKEFPVLIHPYNGALVLTTLHYKDEIVDPRALMQALGIKLGEIKPDEVELAKIIIEQLSGKVNLEEYKDEFAEAVKELVKKKAKGEKYVAVEPVTEEEVMNLMEALQATVKALKKKKKGQK